MKRIALVGVTGYGAVHFNYLSALTDQGLCDFAAAAVVNPEHPDAAAPLSWLRARGAAVYPTAEALFAAKAGRLDLVTLPVGIAAHEPLVKAALAAGANVLVEKPAAGCTAAVDRMVEAERAAAPLRVFVGFQHMSAPEVRKIKDCIASGMLGRPLRVVCTGVWPRGDAYYRRNSWAARLTAPDGTPVRDSPANNAFAHYVNLGLFFASTDPVMPAEALSVEGALYRARPEIETFDTCIVRFATDSGASVTMALSHSSDEGHNPRIRVECERGTVLWSLDGPWSIEGVASGTATSPQEAMFRAVLGFVRDGCGGEANLCSLAMARAQVRAIELLTEELRVTPLEKSAFRRDDGQWIVSGLPAFFDRVFETDDLLIPDWK